LMTALSRLRESTRVQGCAAELLSTRHMSCVDGGSRVRATSSCRWDAGRTMGFRPRKTLARSLAAAGPSDRRADGCLTVGAGLAYCGGEGEDPQHRSPLYPTEPLRDQAGAGFRPSGLVGIGAGRSDAGKRVGGGSVGAARAGDAGGGGAQSTRCLERRGVPRACGTLVGSTAGTKGSWPSFVDRLPDRSPPAWWPIPVPTREVSAQILLVIVLLVLLAVVAALVRGIRLAASRGFRRLGRPT
jgi:hypothetical protein